MNAPVNPETILIPFVKMHGTGNDFVVLDHLEHPLPADFDFPSAARSMCRRHFGIGGDGLLLLDKPSDPGAAVRMRMWNPDGSEDMCGNGLRCIIRLAQMRGHVEKTEFTVETLAGLRAAAILPDGRIRVGMGEPILEPTQIPVDLASLKSTSSLDYIIPTEAGPLHCSTLSTGSTHTVIWLDTPLPEDIFQQLSPLLETDGRFPERTSLMWAQVLDKTHIQIRIWERGAGETLACGTGACATAVAAQMTGRCGPDMRVDSRGGTLQIEWQPGGEISMTGDAHIVCTGNFHPASR